MHLNAVIFFIILKKYCNNENREQYLTVELNPKNKLSWKKNLLQ